MQRILNRAYKVFNTVCFATLLFISGHALAANDDTFTATDLADNTGTAQTQVIVALRPYGGNLDLDGDQRYDALSDGLLILRSMFGLTGDALILGALSTNAMYTTAAEIESRFQNIESRLDVDDNGITDALTDGLIILRHLFGLSGDDLVKNVIASDAQRTSAYQISSYVGQLTSLNVKACSNSPQRFYQMASSGNATSYSIEGEDRDFFEISSDGYLSFKGTVPPSSEDGDDIFEVGIIRTGPNINDEILWLSITLVPGYSIGVTQLSPGKGSLLRLSGNNLSVKGILYSPSRELIKADINGLTVNSIVVTDIEEINGDLYWSVELSNKPTSITLEASTECGDITDSYRFYQNESDIENPIGAMMLDEDNNRIVAVNRIADSSHYYVSYDLIDSTLAYFVPKGEGDDSLTGYTTLNFSFNPSSGDIFTSERNSSGLHSIFRTNINTGEITYMEQATLYSFSNIIPVNDYYSQGSWIMRGSVRSAANQFSDGILTVSIDQQVSNYFQVIGYRPIHPSYTGFLVDAKDGGVILEDRLPTDLKPFVSQGERIQHINGSRYLFYKTGEKMMLYNVDTSQRKVLIDLEESPPPEITLTHKQMLISSDGNSVYSSGSKFMVFDVPTKQYNVIFGAIGDRRYGFEGRLVQYNSASFLADNDETLILTYGYECEEGKPETKKIAAVNINSGNIIYDSFFGSIVSDCARGRVLGGYKTENKILLADGEKIISLDLSNGIKTTLITLSEEIYGADLDEKDSKLYLVSNSRFYIVDMNTNEVIGTRLFEETPLAFGSPHAIKKNTTTSAIYIGKVGGIFEFNEDSLDSQPTAILESSGEHQFNWLASLQYSAAFNSLYLASNNFRLSVVDLDDLTLTSHQLLDTAGYGSPLFDGLAINDNAGVIYFMEGGGLHIYDIEANQASLILN